MTKGHVVNVLKVAVAAALVWWVIDKAGWENISRALSNMNRGQWALGLSVVLVATVISMLRWHVLMSAVGLNSSPWIAMRLGFIGVFFNNVVPGLTGGDLVKAFYVSRENPGYRARAVVSVVVDRVIGIVALALIAAVVIPLDLVRFGEAAVGIYGFLLAAGVGAVFTLSRRAKQKLRSLLGRFGRTSDREGPSLLSRVDEAVSIYRDRMGTIWLTLGMSFVVHMLIIVALMIFGGALAEGGLQALEAGQLADTPAGIQRADELRALAELSLTTYCSIVPIIMIISALPIAPAGWGVGEAAFVYFFATVGVAEQHAVALSLTYRITTLLVSLLGGLFLILDRKRVLEAAHEEAVEEGRAS